MPGDVVDRDRQLAEELVRLSRRRSARATALRNGILTGLRAARAESEARLRDAEAIVVAATKYRTAEDNHEERFGRSEASFRRCERLAGRLDWLLGEYRLRHGLEAATRARDAERRRG